MSRLRKNPTLLTGLYNNTPFVYAHLVKFERPKLEYATNATRETVSHYSRFAYITDAAYDIDFDDGTTFVQQGSINNVANGTQTYVANKLLKVGQTQEATKIKVNSIGLDIDATALDVSVTDVITITRTDDTSVTPNIIKGTIVLPNATTNIRDDNFSSLGFKVDDKIKFSNKPYTLRITGFSNNGNTMSYVYIDRDPGNGAGSSSTLPANGSLETFSTTITVSNEESSFLVSNSLDTSYVNRKVIVYKAFFYADNPHLMMGTPIKLFEGIITGGSYKESPTKAVMSWTIKSHWGDWEQKKGRITSADFHQALDQNGQPNRLSTLKPGYAFDYGFMHAEQSLSVIATYTDIIEDMKEHKHKSWLGLVTKYKYEMIDVEVTRNSDLRFDLQARRIPVVYGVQRVSPIPVFADVSAETGEGDQVFLAHVLAEGPIHSIMNIYVNDIPLVCVDAADYAARFGNTEGDLECVGRTDQGLVLGGATPDNSGGEIAWQSEDGTKVLTQEQMDRIIDASENMEANIGQLIEEFYAVNAHIDSTKSSSFTADRIGITHERKLKFDTPIDWQLEFHAGYYDQETSSLLSTQANTTGKKFRIQQDYWTSGNSGVEYWGPSHRLRDTAYTALRFDITADQTTAPKLHYVIRGKQVECFNYDGSYMHSTLITHATESMGNFKTGDTVSLKTGRDFTASSDTGTYAGSKTANDELFTATIIEIFSFVDARRITNYRVRWNLTGDQQDLLNEAKHFYMQKGSYTWNMVTWDGTINIDTVFQVAEIIEETVSNPTSSGTSNVTVTVSNPSSNFSNFTSDGNAEFAYFTDGTIDEAGYVAGSQDSMTGAKRYSQNRTGTYDSSNNRLTFANTSSTTAPPSNKVTIVNKVKLKGSGISTTDDFYNNKRMWIRRQDEDGDSYTIHRTITDYDGSTQIATVNTPWSVDDVPKVDERVYIYFGQEETIANGQDLRQSVNFVPMLIDYLTSTTYGASVTLDQLDLDSFRLAAQICDTQSDVIVEFNGNVTLIPNDIYRYYENGEEKWRGTVVHNYNSTTKTFGGTGAENHWLFTNVTGKLTNKWNDWKERKVGDLIWKSDNTSLYKVSSNGVQTAIDNNASVATTVTLNKLTSFGSGAGPATPQIKSTSLVTNPVSYDLYDSDDVKFWKYLGWEDQAQRYVTRHQGNMTVDTNQTVFAIIDGFLEHFNGQLAFVDGKYRLTTETTRLPEESDSNFTDSALLAGSGTPTVGDLDLRARYITEGDIIGKINIKDQGLSKSYNSMTAQIDDPQINFSSRSVSFFDSHYLRKDRGVVKSTSFQAKGITNYFNARMLVKQILDRSRYNRKISFTMAPLGLSILPGEIIRIEYPRFGWTSNTAKLFRVETVSLKEDCLIDLTASEYNDSIYRISPPKNSAFYADNTAVAVARVPSAPTNVQVTTEKAEAANSISWEPSTGISPTSGHYEIWRKQGALSGDPSIPVTGNSSWAAELVETIDAAQSHAATPSTSRPRWQDSDFQNNSPDTYHYWVRAYNNLEVQTTSGKERKNYYSPFNANSNYGDATDAAAVARSVSDGDSGSDPITVELSRFAAFVTCDTSGAPVLASGSIPNSGTEIVVKEAEARLQYVPGGTGNGEWSVTVTPTNMTVPSSNYITDSGNYATVTNATGMTANIGTLVFSITGKKADGTSFTRTAEMVFTKVIPAASGRTVELSASKYVINYSEAGLESDSITLTATAAGFDHITPYFAFYRLDGSTWTQIQGYGATNTKVIDDADEPATGTSKQFKVEVQASTGGVVLARDNVSIYGVQDGSDAITAFLTNPSVTLAADKDGNVTSFSTAVGTFKVFVGGDERTTHSDVSFSASGASNTGSSSSPAFINTNGVYNVTSLSADSGSVNLTATIAAGSTLLGGPGSGSTPAAKVITLPFTLTKARRGEEGPTSTTPGPDGLRSVQGYLYYESTGTTAPAAPSGTTYYITGSNAGTVQGTGINDSGSTNVWKNSPNTQDATSSNTFWIVRYSGIEASAGANTITVSYSSVTQQTNFEGVVTFVGGTFKHDVGSGISNITTIDGGNIDTGTITANQISTDILRFDGQRGQSGNMELKNGTIAGWAVSQYAIQGTSSSSGNIRIAVNKTAYAGSQTGFFLGIESGTTKFDIGSSTEYMRWTGSELQIKGRITADALSLSSGVNVGSGKAGGWDLTATTIESANDRIKLDSANARIDITDTSGNLRVRLGQL